MTNHPNRSKLPVGKYAIRDKDGYWFKGFENGEPLFVNASWRARKWDNEGPASRERDVLANLCQDDGMTIEMIL